MTESSNTSVTFKRCPMCGAKEVGPADRQRGKYGCDECDYYGDPKEFGVHQEPKP